MANPPQTHPALSREFIDQINQKATTWTAGQNFHPSTSMETIRQLLGRLPESKNSRLPQKTTYLPSEIEDLPENFDARKEWSDCPTIPEIRDQGGCGSCWAVAAVEVMSDRSCIASKGELKIRYSSEDLLSCCHSCGMGCNGGYMSAAFYHWQRIGIVSGGPYGSPEGCRPYSLEPCEHHVDGPRPKCGHHSTPSCVKNCQDGYSKKYSEDLHKASKVYGISSNENKIMAELKTHGPVEAGFDVYADFVSYKSGVYKYVHGGYLGGHAIKVLGWGVENGVKYWLCANSWNTDWGDKGYFKILRGENECGIEGDMVAGLPLLE